MKTPKTAGFSLIEGIISSLIMGVALAGMFGVWAFVMTEQNRDRKSSEAAQIGRSELERAKVYGVSNLPLGTYSSVSGTATWTGAYIASSSSWSSGSTAYFDMTGARLSSSTGAIFSLQVTFVDSNVQSTNSGSYALTNASTRSAIVTVKNAAGTSTLFVIGTELVKGGI